MMRYGFTCLLCVLFMASAAAADVGVTVDPLPCGIYGQDAKPFVEKDLDTQDRSSERYTMETRTEGGKLLTVEVMNVSIKMPGERSHVTVYLDGRPLAKSSHQDLPLYLEVHVDDVKYRIICLRNE